MNIDTAKLIALNPDLKVDGELSHHNSTGGFGDHTTKEMVDMARNYYKNVDTEGMFKTQNKIFNRQNRAAVNVVRVTLIRVLKF